MKLTIWRDVPVRIRVKIWHKHKNKGILHKDFCRTFGEIPVAEIDDDNQVRLVVNTRGKAYAARKRAAYRKGYNREKQKRRR